MRLVSSALLLLFAPLGGCGQLVSSKNIPPILAADATDADGDLISLELIEAPALGDATVSDLTLIYVPHVDVCSSTRRPAPWPRTFTAIKA